MTTPWRLGLFVLALIVLAPAVWQVAHALPAFGAPAEQYGAAVNGLLTQARHVTNMVAAVNFDVRGFDTIGEESMLVCAVTGAVVLLRGTRGENITDRAGKIPGRAVASRTDAVTLLCRIAATLTLLFGLYMVLHGTVTPGGGFQGGAIAGSSLMLLYLGEGYEGWRRIVRSPAFDVLEGGGAFIFVGTAAVPLMLGFALMQNTLPFGTPKDLYSGGLMVVANFAVGLSVAGSFGILLLEFMEETRSPESDSMPNEED
jgi:multicomponent Na+:H+ antiporter subunit B